MAHQDPVDPLSAFDALLRQELSVEPSNNLLPRVREQIRTEPAASRWMGLWRFAPLAAAAALVLAIGVFMLSRCDRHESRARPHRVRAKPDPCTCVPDTAVPRPPALPNLEPRAANSALADRESANSEQRAANSGTRRNQK